mmetsp:Transcript_32184/g.23768  ORF Transcript_32184/g.23768 Transcript_32184/m.23768 type:complete len:106 (-) Transcript_32184:540-857(-)
MVQQLQPLLDVLHLARQILILRSRLPLSDYKFDEFDPLLQSMHPYQSPHIFSIILQHHFQLTRLLFPFHLLLLDPLQQRRNFSQILRISCTLLPFNCLTRQQLVL